MFSKPRSIFAEMPWNIKQDIIDSTDFRTRCSLRKCSKALRSQVNNSNAFILPLAFVPTDHTIRLTWGNDDDVEIVIYYRSEADGCSVNGKFIFGENYIDRSVADFAAVAKHPRTMVDDVLVIDNWERSKLRTRENQIILRAFEKEFAAFPLRLQHLQFFLRLNQHDHMRVLALSRPETLKSIGFVPMNDWQDTNDLVASEHWKRARKVEMIGFRNFRAQNLVHFHEWYVEGILITEEDAKAFVEKIFELGESFQEAENRRGQLTPEAVNYILANFDYHTNGYVKKMPGTMYHLKIEITYCTNFTKVLSSEVEE